jgi:hypothetical protein
MAQGPVRVHRLIYWARPRAGMILGHWCGPLFGPKPKFHADRVLGGVLGAPVEMLLEH